MNPSWFQLGMIVAIGASILVGAFVLLNNYDKAHPRRDKQH